MSKWVAELDPKLTREQLPWVTEVVYASYSTIESRPQECAWRKATSVQEIIERLQHNKAVLDSSGDWVIAVRSFTLNNDNQVRYGYAGARSETRDVPVRWPDEGRLGNPSEYGMPIDGLLLLKADDLVPVSTDEVDEAQALFLAALRGQEVRRATREA